MTSNIAPNLELDDVTETSIRCTYKSNDIFVKYRLIWRVYGTDWSTAESIFATSDEKKACIVEATNCLPATTYELQFFGITSSGDESDPSRVLTVDTDTPECTPKTGCLCIVS